MVTVDMIGRVRHAYLVKGHRIKRNARELRLSRNTVRDIVRSGGIAATTSRCGDSGAFVPRLDAMLAENAGKASAIG